MVNDEEACEALYVMQLRASRTLNPRATRVSVDIRIGRVITFNDTLPRIYVLLPTANRLY
jgi:hypothetical protein